MQGQVAGDALKTAAQTHNAVDKAVVTDAANQQKVADKAVAGMPHVTIHVLHREVPSNDFLFHSTGHVEFWHEHFQSPIMQDCCIS